MDIVKRCSVNTTRHAINLPPLPFGMANHPARLGQDRCHLLRAWYSPDPRYP